MTSLGVVLGLLAVVSFSGCERDQGKTIDRGANKLVLPGKVVFSPSGDSSLSRRYDRPDSIMLEHGKWGGLLNPISYSNEFERLSWVKAKVAWDDTGRIWIVKGDGKVIVLANDGNEFHQVLPSQLPPLTLIPSVLKDK